MKKLIKKVEKKSLICVNKFFNKDIKNINRDKQYVKEGVREEFFGHVNKYKAVLAKISYLDKLDPINDEIPILEAEAKALLLRIDRVFKEGRDKINEMEHRVKKTKVKA